MARAVQNILRRISPAFILVPIAVSVSSSAHAQENKWYVDLGYQATDFAAEDETGFAELDGTLGHLTGHLGYNIASFIAVEGELSLGVKGEKDIASYGPGVAFLVPPPRLDIKQTYVAGLSGRLQHMFGDRLRVFAKGGIASSEFELTSTPQFSLTPEEPEATSEKSNEVGASYGIGAEVYLIDDFGIRVDLTRYDWGDIETTGVSLGISHRF